MSQEILVSEDVSAKGTERILAILDEYHYPIASIMFIAMAFRLPAECFEGIGQAFIKAATTIRKKLLN